jgi:hypothetical protein
MAATRTCSRRSSAVSRVRAGLATAQSSGSRQTVTETSSTGSAIGGSGFEHLTETASIEKSASRRSAIAVLRRSSVLYERCWATSETVLQTSP